MRPDDVDEIKPVIMARPATDAEISKTARALIRDAKAAGWRAEATYARAWAPVVAMVEDIGAPLTPSGRVARKKATQSQLVDSVVLRLRSPRGARAVVVYEGGKPAHAWIWAEGLDGVSLANVTTVTALVKGTWPKPITDTELLETLERAS